MRGLSILTFIFYLVNSSVLASHAEAAAPGSSPGSSFSSIETVIPNRSYLLKLDCISCPYLIRHSNRDEWEQDPRPSQLTLALYIDGPRLYLQGESLNPLWYERRAPTFYNLPYPFAPPFTANQIGKNESLQREENNVGYGMPIRQFELAYEYDMVTYAPKDRAREWEVLIQFEITGLRHEGHRPMDIPFFSSTFDERKGGTLPGVTSVVRLVLGYTELEETEISALELMPKDGMDRIAPKAIEALRKAAEVKGDETPPPRPPPPAPAPPRRTPPTAAARRRDINGQDGKDMYTEHVSFKPGEWNDCGMKDEWGRQMMCSVDDLKERSPVGFVLSLMLVAISLLCILIAVVSGVWLGVRFLRGRNSEEVDAAKGETDALLLVGDEELEEKEKDVER